MIAQGKDLSGIADLHMPRNALDWRFFLPMPVYSRVLVVDNDHQDYVRFLEKLGISSIKWTTDFSEYLSIQSQSPSFDIILMPHGLPGYPGTSAGLEIYERIEKMLFPGGVLLVGFLNFWKNLYKLQANTYYSTSSSIRSMLLKANFKLIRFYGVTPNLSAPGYIFPLSHHALGFVLLQKYMRKPFFRYLKLLWHPCILKVLLYIVPAYYVIARSPDKNDIVT